MTDMENARILMHYAQAFLFFYCERKLLEAGYDSNAYYTAEKKLNEFLTYGQADSFDGDEISNAVHIVELMDGLDEYDLIADEDINPEKVAQRNVKWVTSAEDACEDCKKNDKAVFKIKDLPITHPNCKCGLVANTIDNFDGLDGRIMTDGERELLSIILSFIPIIGDLKDVQEALTGIDLVTGKKIAWWERVITVGTALIPLVGGALARKGIKLSNDGVWKIYQTAADWLKKSDDAADVGKHADDVARGVGKTLKPQNLMDELAQSGVKYNTDDVVMVTKTPDGKLMWLENGNSSAGLKHIVNGKATDFANKGITDIPNFLQQTLQNTPINTGMGTRGPFADYLINGSTYRVAYGTNGFIVSFYPIN